MPVRFRVIIVVSFLTTLGLSPMLSANDHDNVGEARRPQVIVAPLYPRKAQTRGIEGHCQVEFSVTSAGSTADIVPVDCSPQGYFEKAAVKAAKRFRYPPVAKDSSAATSPERLRHRFDFELD